MSNLDKQVIMVVDDEAHILHVVSLKLRNAGYEVVTAQDGEEAYTLALQCDPVMVITDFQMPIMTGLELCKKLSENPSTAGVPVLMLTARGYSLNEEDIKQTNIVEVLSKPFSPREILTRVQELIAKPVVES